MKCQEKNEILVTDVVFRKFLAAAVSTQFSLPFDNVALFVFG